MAWTVRRAVEGRLPACYIPHRLEQRRNRARQLRAERARKPDKPEELVCYSSSESEEEGDAARHYALSGSRSFVEWTRAREMQAPEPRRLDPAHGTRHMLTHDMFRETPLSLGTLNKVFCSQWLSDRQIVFGTKCNKLMVYDVRTRALDAIPLIGGTAAGAGGGGGAGGECGIHALRVNPSRSLLATSARHSAQLALYSLPGLEPLALGPAHNDWILDCCWLDDRFLVTGSRDSKLALWRCDDESPQTEAGVVKQLEPLAVRECRGGQKVRALAFNGGWGEVAALTLNGYMHVFRAGPFRQLLSRKLPSCQDLVCLCAHDDRSLYAVGCKSYTLLLDARTLQTVRRVTSRYNGCGIRSASFRGDTLTIGTGLGMLMFYEVRAHKYLESEIHSSKTVALKASKGYVFPDEEADGFSQVKYVPAIYTHAYDESGTRIFTAGGPLPAPLQGNYAGLWH